MTWGALHVPTPSPPTSYHHHPGPNCLRPPSACRVNSVLTGRRARGQISSAWSSGPNSVFPQRRGKPLLYHVTPGINSALSGGSVCPLGRQPSVLICRAIALLLSQPVHSRKAPSFPLHDQKVRCIFQNKKQSSLMWISLCHLAKQKTPRAFKLQCSLLQAF